MAKKKSIRRVSNKKRGRPKIRFSFWGLILIFALSFSACFILYMLAANFNEDFFSEEFDNIVVEDQADIQAGNTGDNDNASDSNGSGSSLGVSASNPVPESGAKDTSYFEKCCLVTDSTLIDMGKFTDLKDIIGSAELNAKDCNTVKIESSYGNSSIYEIIQAKKPENIYIMLGSDLGTASVDEMIESYTALVKNIHGYLPESKVYIMQLPPIREDGGAVSGKLINEFNTKLLTLANTTGVYCIDTNTALKGVDGGISEEYRDAESGALTEAAYRTISDYILRHTV